MYNNDMSSKLLNVVVEQVSEEELQKIQQIVDVDKYQQSYDLGYDLCGYYAPFCALCDKSLKNPCATAYIKMLQPESAPKKIRIGVARRKKSSV